MKHLLRKKGFVWASVLALCAASSAFAAPGLSLTPVSATTTDNSPAVGPQISRAKLLFAPPTAMQRQAFQSVTRQALPMTPDQITQFKTMLAATQKAAASNVAVPPKPITSSVLVSLAPGATPPVISLQKGFISSLVFVDVAGNKWPIDSYDLGNAKAFNIQWQKGSNTLLVQATTPYTYGNMAVQLHGTNTPVMLTLVPGQHNVDYRVDLHVQGRSPTAQPTMAQSAWPTQVSNTLLNVLNGIPPTHAKAVSVSGAQCESGFNNCQGWVYKEQLYLRIPSVILSPRWLSTIQSADGVHAYILRKTPSVLVSVHGKPMTIKIEGY
jgi:intracellular multiplication protein IcmK